MSSHTFHVIAVSFSNTCKPTEHVFRLVMGNIYLTCNLVFLIFLSYLFPSTLTSLDAEKSVAVVIRTQGDEVVVRH